MTAYAEHSGSAVLSIHKAGWVCLLVSVFGAVIVIALAFVQPAVDRNQWTYPLDATGYTLLQTWWAIQYLGVTLGLAALQRTGAVGSGNLGKFGHYGAVTGMVGIAAAELAAISAANDTTTTTRAGILVSMYGVFSIVIAIALTLEGVAVLWTVKWQGWKRRLPLVLGLWVLVPMLPSLSLPSYWATFVTGWMLLFAALGWALVQHQDHTA